VRRTEPTLDANGFPNKQDYGNSYLKLSTAVNTLSVADYFAMFIYIVSRDSLGKFDPSKNNIWQPARSSYRRVPALRCLG
jgi:hypothetical protein